MFVLVFLDFNPIFKIIKSFQNFWFLGGIWAILGGQNWTKIDFFRCRHVCTHFFGISTLFPNLSNNSYILDFWGAFGAILGGQNLPEIDLEWPRGGGLRMRGLLHLYFPMVDWQINLAYCSLQYYGMGFWGYFGIFGFDYMGLGFFWDSGIFLLFWDILGDIESGSVSFRLVQEFEIYPWFLFFVGIFRIYLGFI